MIQEIKELIKQLKVSLDRDKYKDLFYNVYEFAMEVAQKRFKLNVSLANMEMEKAKYQVLNRDKYNSDRTASSHFKTDNAESVNKVAVYEAEVILLETELKRFDKMLAHFNGDEIRNLALDKRIREVENSKKI